MNGYEALRSRAAFLDLSSRGKLRVTGEDRVRFLHAMSTNDIANLAEGAGLYAFFLSAQGRILADAHIYYREEALWLDTESEVSKKLFEHLNKYIIADDVLLEDWTETWTAIGLEGPESLGLASKLGASIPPKVESIKNFQSGFVARIAASGSDGIRFFLPETERDRLFDQLREFEIPEADAEAARIVRIENKRPRFGDDISERYLVQETQQLQAVHFTKGCYIGQEIVERVRSRGQVHRLLTPISIHGTVAPGSGTRLSVDGKEIGEITSAVFSPATNQVVGFAYLRGEGLLPGAALQLNTDSVTEQASIRL